MELKVRDRSTIFRIEKRRVQQQTDLRIVEIKGEDDTGNFNHRKTIAYHAERNWRSNHFLGNVSASGK